MSVFTDFFAELLGSIFGALLFVTGEVIRCAATLGRHRIRWWEPEEVRETWGSLLLGALFWGGVGALLYFTL